MNNEERIYDWAQTVQLVRFVELINKKFAGVVLYDKRDAIAVTEALDSLLEEITQIKDVSKTGLGVPFFQVGNNKEFFKPEESNG